MSLDRKYRRGRRKTFYDRFDERWYDDSDGSLDESYGRGSTPLVEQVPLGAYVVNPGGFVPLYLTERPAGCTICSAKDLTSFRQAHAYAKTPGFAVPFLCNAESKSRVGNYVKVTCRYNPKPPWSTVVMRRPINPGIDTGVTVNVPVVANTPFVFNYSHPDFDSYIQSLPDGVNMIDFYIANVGTDTLICNLSIDSVETYLPTTVSLSYTPVESLTFVGTSPSLTAWGGAFGIYTSVNTGVYTANVPLPRLYVNYGPIPFFHGSIRVYKDPGFVLYKNCSVWIYDGSPTTVGTNSYGGGEAKDTFTFTREGTNNGILAGVYTFGYTPVFA